MKTTNNKGLVTLIFVFAIALIATLVLMIGQSQLFLALQRGQSFSDTIIAGYQAESEINDIVYRVLTGRTGSMTFPYSKDIGPNFSVNVQRKSESGLDYIDATVSRAFAVSKVRATLNGTVTETVTAENKDIIIMLDCTGSMDDTAIPGGRDKRYPTRFSAQEEAAVKFVQNIAALNTPDKIKIGVGVFTDYGKWLRIPGGRDITLTSNHSYAEIQSAIENGFGLTRDTSPACMGGSTNIGGGMIFAHDSLMSMARPDSNKIAVLITDGAASRWTYNDRVCRMSRSCSDDCSTLQSAQFLGCVITPSSQAYISPDPKVISSTTGFGRWDPSISRYVVTVLEDEEESVHTIRTLDQVLGPDYYIKSRYASNLSSILQDVFTRIENRSGVITIKRVIPEGD